LIVAPAGTCAQLTSNNVCTTLASHQIVGSDGITRFVVGTADEFNMEPSELLTCVSS
jgi:hypothetical protein